MRCRGRNKRAGEELIGWEGLRKHKTTEGKPTQKSETHKTKIRVDGNNSTMTPSSCCGCIMADLLLTCHNAAFIFVAAGQIE